MKKSLLFAVGRQKLSILELQTVLFEAANLINSWPIGTHHTQSDDGCYWSPNEMILGKSAGGGIVIAEERNKLGHRLSLVENVLNGFWKRWQMLYMYSMAPLRKWTKKHRNVQKCDVVLVEDSNALRGNWTIGRVNATPEERGWSVMSRSRSSKPMERRQQCPGQYKNSLVWFRLKNNSGPPSVTQH